MKQHLAIVAILSAALTAQAGAAPQDVPRPAQSVPKQTAPKQAPPKRAITKKKPAPAPLAVDPASKTVFVSYDIGTLRMVGKSAGDTIHTIGTLRMTGRAGASAYDIGTLSMSGMRER